MIILLVISAVLLAVPAHDFVRRGTFRRLALRNALRRKTEALILVLGASLGTAIITAAFITGDSFDQSIRNIAKTDLGPTDIAVSVQDADRLDTVSAAVRGDGLDGTDGVLGAVSVDVAVIHPGADGGQRAEPRTSITEFDIAEAAAFGGRPDDTGLAGVEPIGPGEAVMADRVARTLSVDEGDRVVAFAYGRELPLTVTRVVPTRGLMGSSQVVVAPGTIAPLVDPTEVASGNAVPPSGFVLVSNDGGVFDGADGSELVKAEVIRRVENLEGVEVSPVKADLLSDAEEEGDSLAQLFTGIGSFSVIAGILLLVNLFVMLAEERKAEMGMQRAVGFKRNHLTRSFAIEGMGYALASAVVGAISGIAVGWAIARVSSSLFAEEGDALVIGLSVVPSTLIVGGLTGFIIAAITAWATSARIARLNIISAIRDLPDPRPTGRRLRSLLLGLLGVGAGAFLAFTGLNGEVPSLLMAGPPIAFMSAITLAVRLAPRRPVVLALAGLSLAWGVAVFPLFPDVMGDSDIDVFVVMGVVMVAAAVAIVTALDRVWAKLTATGGASLAPRLALAYPLNRLFRTALLLGMFALVIFTIGFIAVLDGTFSSQAPSFARDVSAGYDVHVRSNAANPLRAEILTERDDVAAVATITRSFPDFVLGDGSAADDDDRESWGVSGFDESLLQFGAPLLTERDDAYATDDAAYRAVLADPALVIVDSFFFNDEDGPGSAAAVGVGDIVTMIDPISGRETLLTVAGVFGSDLVFFGAFASNETVTDNLDLSSPSRHLVKVADGLDADTVAADITGVFVANGVDAESFVAIAKEEVRQQSGFFTLMRGYLGLGLVIGIAGLAVVMVRAVRERRRQIGMLRAMGVTASTVRRAFLAEGLFIAAQGIVIGIVLSVVTSYSVLTSSETFGDEELDFTLPWGALAFTAVVPLIAVLAATVVPAARAAAIRPAAALRIAD